MQRPRTWFTPQRGGYQAPPRGHARETDVDFIKFAFGAPQVTGKNWFVAATARIECIGAHGYDVALPPALVSCVPHAYQGEAGIQE